MKKILVVFALLVGCVSIAQSAETEKWTVTHVTGTHLTIGGNGRPVKVKRITISSGTTTSASDSLMAFSTIPVAAINGADGSLFGGHLFQATQTVIPSTVFLTTTSMASNGFALSNGWYAGDCEDCYVTTLEGGALIIRKSQAQSGGAFQASVMWSQ